MTADRRLPTADCVIAGAGPAGSIAAIVLARAGVRVRLFDRARFPRDKLCGDTVNPGALAVLTRLGLAHVTDGGLPVDGMIVTGDTGVRCAGLYGQGQQGRALRRHTLDAALVCAAVRAGVVVEDGVVVQAPLVEGGQVRGLLLAGSDGRPRRERAAMVIAADGASSRLARALTLSRHSRRPRRWAIGACFEDVRHEESSACCGEMHLRRGRYIGLAPLPGRLTNACVVTADRTALRDAGALLLRTLHEDPQLADRFADARLVTRPVCLGPLAVENTACGVPGLLLAGDAAGFIDPMTGDGLRFAFRGAELAALAALSALSRGTSDAHRALARARRREFGAKWRFNRTLRALAGSPTAMTAAARITEWSDRWVQYAVRYAGDA